MGQRSSQKVSVADENKVLLRIKKSSRQSFLYKNFYRSLMTSGTTNIIVANTSDVANIFKTKYTEFTFIFLLAAAALETNPFLFIINEVKLALKYSLGFRILMLNPSSTHLRWVAYTF
jgi:hypothetical protein